ncbi:hypothetical protein PoB_003918700 [Plakobranchus ocellatus]|uniref:Uncharacterized protein n=1 Tax=Plakobranchus ocellatus TaxID=259542 RepID=A0AAV4AZH7_9GAST|nr:hypothetical protein PoB_003918700 [Plakobranchus ocellatus]
MIRVQHGLLPTATQYNSDWPHSGGLQHNIGASRSLPSLPTLESEVEASLDRVLRQQNLNRDSLHAYLRESSSAGQADTRGDISSSSSAGREAAGDAHSWYSAENGQMDSGSDLTSALGAMDAHGDVFTVTNVPPHHHHYQQQLQQQQQPWTPQGFASTSSSPGSSSVFASNSPQGITTPSDTSAMYGVQQHFFPGAATRPVSLQEPGMFYGVSHQEDGEEVGGSPYGVLGKSLARNVFKSIGKEVGENPYGVLDSDWE